MLRTFQDAQDDVLISSFLLKVVRSSDYHEAVVSGDVNRVRKLIESGADINQRESTFNFTPIFAAIITENVRIFQMMVQAGADLKVEAKFRMTPLACAVESGNINLVTRLLDFGVDIETKGQKNESVLHVAAAAGRAEMVKFLIGRGLGVNCRNDDGETSLHKAVCAEHKEVVKVLLACGADVNVGKNSITKAIPKDETEQSEVSLFNHNFFREQETNITPLLLAAQKNRTDIADTLIQAGADVNVKTDSLHLRPLHFAAAYGNLQLVKLLLKAGSDVNAIALRLSTPLHIAVICHRLKIIEALLNVKGIEVNSSNRDGASPLVRAAGYGFLPAVKLLCMKGAVINGPASLERLPLHEALFEGREQVANWLINNGANVRAQNSVGHTALIKAACCKEISLQIFEALIRKGANINSKCKEGKTALHYAAFLGNLKIVRFLVDQGADPNVLDKKNFTVLHFAVKSRCIKTVEYLITETCVNLERGLVSPLHAAVMIKQEEIVRLLLRKGADVNAGICDGETPMHIAAGKGEQVMTELLLKYKPNLEIRMEGGRTALFLAVEKKHEKIVEVLLDKGADPNCYTDSFRYPMHVAVSSENINLVKALLKKGAYFDVDDESNNYCLPVDLAREIGNAKLITLLELIKKLFRAVAKSEEYQIECCIQAGAIVNARKSNASGKTALHSAIIYKNFEAVSLLLTHKADFTLPTDFDKVSLHYAILSGDLRIVEILLNEAKKLTFIEHSFFINAATENGSTPLHYAARKNNAKAVKLLIEHGAVYNMKNYIGETPYHLATDPKIKNYLDLIKKLFEVVKEMDASKAVSKIVHSERSAMNGRDSDEGRTPLVWTILKDHSKVAKNLLNCGASCFLVTNKGASPLHIAASKGNLEIVKALLHQAKNVNPEKANNFVNALTENGSAALHIATSLDIVKLLLQEGAIYDMQNVKGKTLQELTKNDDIREYLRTVSNLFESLKKDGSAVSSSLTDLDVEDFKAITSTRNESGQTLLQVALANKKMKVASKILEKLKSLN